MSKMGRSTVLQLPQAQEQRLEICCRAARDREERGEYEAACEILAPFWRGPGTSPSVDQLPRALAADLLTRIGSLTGRFGSKRQIPGAQELAKNLLTQAAEISDNKSSWAEARKYLAACYWREGAVTEARDILEDALREVHGEFAVALTIDLAMIEWSGGRPERAVALYGKIETQIQAQSEFVRANYCNGLALSLKSLCRFDEALVLMAEAARLFESVGNIAYQTASEINLANLYVKTNSFPKAHAHLDRAEHLARLTKDDLHLAQGLDSRAQALIAQGDFAGAESAARSSVEILERGGEYGLLVESLVTHARTLSVQRIVTAPGIYIRAYELAAQRLTSERAAQILLELISVCRESKPKQSWKRGECCEQLTPGVCVDAAEHALVADSSRRRTGSRGIVFQWWLCGREELVDGV